MRPRSISRAASAIAFALGFAAVRASPPADHTIFRDTERQIEVRYDFTPAAVEFSARLPDNWSFTVNIDGDQDGKWGDGPAADTSSPHPTGDRTFTKASTSGIFCAQYILASSPQDPARVGASTICGAYPSEGSVEMWGPDAQERATMTLKIPSRDVFGDRPDAHLQICLWDTRSTTCEFSPAAPFILPRPAAGSHE